MAVVARNTGLRYSTVDFNNVPAIKLALLRDDAQLIGNTPSSLKAQIDSGEVRLLAVISPERLPNLPGVPTVAEAVNYKGFLPQSWAGVFAPKATPKAVVDRVGRDLLTVMSDAEFKTFIEARVSGSFLKSSPAEFNREYLEEAKVWRDVFAAMNYKPE
jgi:tripartite-type tricarboxylate transporter receptor subunit TctC